MYNFICNFRDFHEIWKNTDVQHWINNYSEWLKNDIVTCLIIYLIYITDSNRLEL